MDPGDDKPSDSFLDEKLSYLVLLWWMFGFIDAPNGIWVWLI